MFSFASKIKVTPAIPLSYSCQWKDVLWLVQEITNTSLSDANAIFFIAGFIAIFFIDRSISEANHYFSYKSYLISDENKSEMRSKLMSSVWSLRTGVGCHPHLSFVSPQLHSLLIIIIMYSLMSFENMIPDIIQFNVPLTPRIMIPLSLLL